MKGKGREGGVQVEGSRSLTRAIETGVVSLTLGFDLRKCLEARTCVLEKQRVAG